MDRSKILVSVIMPTYNCADFISESIKSVVQQTVDDWELIIVDDCSSDNTDKIVRSFQRKYENIKFIRLQENSGAAIARTKGIEVSVGKYVAFLDSDDLWDKNKLEKQLEFMQKNNALFSCTGYREINQDGSEIINKIVPPKNIDYVKALKLGNPIGNLTVMYNQEKLGKQKVPQIKKRNDFALWLKILKQTKYCFSLTDCLASYRIRSNSLSRKKMSVLKYHWELYRNFEKINFFRSTFYMVCLLVSKAKKKLK